MSTIEKREMASSSAYPYQPEVVQQVPLQQQHQQPSQPVIIDTTPPPMYNQVYTVPIVVQPTLNYTFGNIFGKLPQQCIW